MDITYARCESIVNTLPIGFYTGRRIDVVMDKEAETSFYSPIEDKIIVSYPIIAYRLKNVKAGTCDEEEAVRSMLYHEVSHAILTPKHLNADTPTNIFEDERIETTLRHFYHNVDFRKQLMDMHGGKIPEATDTETAFFNAVRFGLGTARVQQKVLSMLKKYAHLNRNSPLYSSRDDIDTSNYSKEIYELWEMIKKDYKSSPNEFQPKNGSSNTTKQMDSLKQNQQGEKKPSGKSEEQSEQQGQEQGQGRKKQPSAGEEHEPDLSEEELRKVIGGGLTKDPNLDKAQTEQLNEFQRTVEMIINNFNKKNKGGSGINAYSGVFNPRAVTRQDYRFFERSMSTQGNNKFGTCHLNLIIDCSGSFCRNVPITNGILHVLTEIERKNRNFSMDVVFINHKLKICKTVRDREMSAYGSNNIPDDMKEILLGLQKPQTCNYNIVLFDGDALCVDYGDMRRDRKRFSAFDMKQTTLITDPDNEQYMKPPFTQSKVIITKDYTKELIKHITNALMIAFG